MNSNILQVHAAIENNRVKITVAVRGMDQDQWYALTGNANDLSQYMVNHVSNTGRQLAEDDARRMFPEMSGFQYINAPESPAPGATIGSLSEKYEYLKDHLHQMILRPEDEVHRAEALVTLQQLRDLAATAIVQRPNTEQP
jgi:hypothetical protein